MGKQKGRASSSGMAASLVPHAQGAVPTVGFGGYHGAVRVEPAAPSDPDVPIRLTPDVDGEVLQNLKRLGRKDPTTKLKALSALSILFAQKPGEEVVQIVPQWAFEYKRLLLDYNREVRRATHEAMSSLVTAIKKGIAPHLKSLMGPWWFSQFDPAPEVAQAARRSFEAAFPQSERRLDALMFCVKETFLYLSENLKLTTQALSDKATPMDELEDMHQRSFLWLLENVSRYSGEVSSDDTPIKLITDILAKIVWRDYLLLSGDTTSGGVLLSHKNSGLAANTQYPVYYLQDLEKCIVEILDVIADTEDHLLNVSCELLVRDCLDIIQQGDKLPKFQDHVEQLVSFFLSLDQLVVHKGKTWPLERLARPLVEQSLPAIKFMVKDSVYADENFSVTVNRSAYEIVATYNKEETGIDLVIRLPNCYPLRHVEVKCTRSLGISEVKCRKWLLSLTSFVRNQNGAIAEAIRTWKSNFDKEFEGVEECPICYSILHTSNHSVPRLACKTCKHKFHGACLYKWFSTSNKSTCPLCQTPF
nr:unnamed protein product [Digitaria exilis]